MNNQIDGKLYNVTFQAHFQQGTTNIKFPCLFFIQWKTNDQKHATETGRYSPHEQKVTFNQTINLTAPVAFQKTKKTFLKKETQVQLNLLSKNRPDQPKLVGRVTVDLASILNNQEYAQLTEFPLKFCSVNASLTASFKVIQKVETDIQIHELQKSIGDGVSFYSTLKVANDKSKDSSSIVRDLPSNSNYVLEKHVIKKQFSVGGSSPKNSVFSKDLEKKDFNASGFHDNHKEHDKRSDAETKSFKGKLSEVMESTNRKVGSILSEDNKLGEQNIKLKVEADALRLQLDRQQQNNQKIRNEHEKILKENQFNKFQLKQKQSSLDQSNIEINSLKSESIRLRDEVATLREEAVSATIKIAELKDNFNRVSAQLSAAQVQMKRWEGIGQQSIQVKRQFSSQIIDLQSQISQYESICHNLEREKAELESTIKQKTLNEEKLFSQNQNLVLDLETTKNELKAETEIKDSYQVRISHLEQQNKRLVAVESQYEESKNSWDINQGLISEEASRKGERVVELEETLMTLNERIRYIEGENELLTDNVRHSREEYLKLEEAKDLSLKDADKKYQECYQYLEEERTNCLNLLAEKKSLQDTILTLNSKLEKLTKQFQSLKNQHSTQCQKQKEDVQKIQQLKKKCTECEDLILSGNQQKQRQLSQAAQRQRNLEIKIMEFQNQLQASNEQIAMLDEKSNMLDIQLKGREDLIAKLQQGLNTQMQRTQALNNKLMTYFQKDQKLKDLTMVIEDQQYKINKLLVQQEYIEKKYERAILEKKEMINQLVKQLEASQAYSKELAAIIHQGNSQIEALSLEIQLITRKYDILSSSNDQNVSLIQQLQDSIAEARQLIALLEKEKEELKENQNIDAATFQKEKNDLSMIITELEEKMLALNTAIEEKQNLIAEGNSKHVQKENEIAGKDFLLEELNKKIATLDGNKSDLETQLIFQEEQLQEEMVKYKELQVEYETLSNDQAIFDLNKHREEMKERNQTIKKLQSEMMILGNEVSKIPSLERNLKIKTIELNSMKFKGTPDKSAANELIKLKDEEIASLQNEKQHLLNIERQFLNIQHEMSDLRTEVEMMEEEKFNIESLANEKALALEEIKEENRKLLDQITIIGEKHGELEKIVFQMTSGEETQGGQKGQSGLKAENIVLKNQLQQSRHLKQKVQQLEEAAKLSSKTTIQPKTNKLMQSSNSNQVYLSLKKLLQERTKSKQQEKIIEAVNKLFSQQNTKGKSLEEKTKYLSKDFSKLKVQLLKVGEAKNASEKTKMIGQVQTCEDTIRSMVALFD